MSASPWRVSEVFRLAPVVLVLKLLVAALSPVRLIAAWSS